MARAMTTTIATTTKRCCLSALPVRRWEEGMSSWKPLWSLEQQELPLPYRFNPFDFSELGDGEQQEPPLPYRFNPFYFFELGDGDSDITYFKYERMGWLRPWSLEFYYQHQDLLGLFGPLGRIQEDNCPTPSDGIPIQIHRYSDGTEDNGRQTHSDGTPVPRWWEVKFTKPWRLPPSGIPDEYPPPPPPPPPQMSILGSNSNWEGRLKRIKLGHRFRPCPPNYSVQDIVAYRVIEISRLFEYNPNPTCEEDFIEVEQFEYWLDELQGYYEFMELAHELHSIDRLSPLLHRLLVTPNIVSIRGKIAELVTTMVHNNPRSQQLVIELQGLEPLWYNFTSDPDAISRTKALGAISALIRNNKPGITAFREKNGYATLRDALSTATVWFQREALNLVQYLLHENSSDCNTVTELGLTRIMMHLASSDDSEVRVATLKGLLVLARDEGGNSGQLVKNDDKLKQVLQERIIALALEDLDAAREEIQLVNSLWSTCYNELSPIPTMLV